MQTTINGLDAWTSFLSTAEVPILKRTARELKLLGEVPEQNDVRAITSALMLDPLMTLILLRYLQKNKRASQINEVVQIEQALMMVGMQRFFGSVVPQLLAEDMLKQQLPALSGMLQGVQRATRAARYAKDWSVRLKDLHFDEVRITALLHNFAEILLWCYAPVEMAKVRALQQCDKTLRTRDAQRQVLGFKVSDLQLELAKLWQLPELLIHFMERNYAYERQMRTVVLAVNLSRHSANGWDDAALPDDYKEIGELLRMTPEQVREIVKPA